MWPSAARQVLRDHRAALLTSQAADTVRLGISGHGGALDDCARPSRRRAWRDYLFWIWRVGYSEPDFQVLMIASSSIWSVAKAITNNLNVKCE